jgi:hypothetical protein
MEIVVFVPAEDPVKVNMLSDSIEATVLAKIKRHQTNKLSSMKIMPSTRKLRSPHKASPTQEPPSVGSLDLPMRFRSTTGSTTASFVKGNDSHNPTNDNRECSPCQRHVHFC